MNFYVHIVGYRGSVVKATVSFLVLLLPCCLGTVQSTASFLCRKKRWRVSASAIVHNRTWRGNSFVQFIHDAVLTDDVSIHYRPSLSYIFRCIFIYSLSESTCFVCLSTHICPFGRCVYQKKNHLKQKLKSQKVPFIFAWFASVKSCPCLLYLCWKAVNCMGSRVVLIHSSYEMLEIKRISEARPKQAARVAAWVLKESWLCRLIKAGDLLEKDKQPKSTTLEWLDDVAQTANSVRSISGIYGQRRCVRVLTSNSGHPPPWRNVKFQLRQHRTKVVGKVSV